MRLFKSKSKLGCSPTAIFNALIWLKLAKPSERLYTYICKAVNYDPLVGVYDLAITRALRKLRGATVLKPRKVTYQRLWDALSPDTVAIVTYGHAGTRPLAGHSIMVYKENSQLYAVNNSHRHVSTKLTPATFRYINTRRGPLPDYWFITRKEKKSPCSKASYSVCVTPLL